jgi:carboxyl-terminal processing protease
LEPIGRVRMPLVLVAPALLVALVLGVGGGYWLGAQRNQSCPESAEVCEEFALFWQAWELASDNFVDAEAIDAQRMTEGAIVGMLDSLGDRNHTRFLSAEASQRWRESLSGSFEGVGATLNIPADLPVPVIVATLEGSPAEQAGVQAGDLLLKVNGESTEGKTIEEIVAQVRGTAGTTVTLTVQHEGEQLPLDLTVTRARLSVPNVSWTLLPNKVAYVHLVQFAENSSDQLREALTEAKAQGATGIVLDLRNNPGGLVHEAVAVASEFLAPGQTIFLQEDRAGTQQPYAAQGEGLARDLPLVVLVNENSASSAEIVSGALQANDRASVIGVPTAGTGTVLTPYDMEGGAQLLLGTQQWLTPDGEVIKGQGITPDELVTLDLEAELLSPRDARDLSAQEIDASSDAQLVAGLRALSGLATNQATNDDNE